MVWATLTLNVVQTLLKRHSNKTMLFLITIGNPKFSKAGLIGLKVTKGIKSWGKLPAPVLPQTRYNLMDSQREVPKEG